MQPVSLLVRRREREVSNVEYVAFITYGDTAGGSCVVPIPVYVEGAKQ